MCPPVCISWLLVLLPVVTGSKLVRLPPVSISWLLVLPPVATGRKLVLLHWLLVLLPVATGNKLVLLPVVTGERRGLQSILTDDGYIPLPGVVVDGDDVLLSTNSARDASLPLEDVNPADGETSRLDSGWG